MKITNYKAIVLEKNTRIAKLEKENRELRERNENLYRAWRRLMDENYDLKKKYGEFEGMSPEVKARIYKNITGKEYTGS